MGLLFSAAIVLQSLCVLLRWSQLSVRCSFPSSCIILLILLLSGESGGDLGFCFWYLWLLLGFLEGVCVFYHAVYCACR